jgi:beta-glucanase (GH16 family)
MPIIFPGSAGGNTPVSQALPFNHAGLKSAYMFGVVPEAGAVLSGNKVVSTKNQGISREGAFIYQNVDANRPTYSATGGVNGFPCFEFEGNAGGGQFLNCEGNALGLMNNVSGLTLAIVHEPEFTAENMRIFTISGDGAPDDVQFTFEIMANPRGIRIIETTPDGTNYHFLNTFFNPPSQPACEFVVMDFVNGQFRYYYNFILVSEGTFAGTTTEAANALMVRIGAGIGSDYGPFWGYNGKLTRLDVWQGALEPTEIGDLAQAYLAKYFPPSLLPGVTDVIYCTGDSNMQGFGLEYNENIPWLIDERITTPKPYTYVQNYALSGLPTYDTLAYLENEKYVLSRMPAVGTKNRVMCFMGNTNDISQGIPAEYIVENLTNMCQFYKRLGMKIVGSTTLPRGDSYPLDQETDELNDLIRANWAAIGYDVLVDSASMVSLLTDFQVDLIHLNPTGASIVADAFVAGVESLPGWSLPTFQDDFDGPSLDGSKWITTLAWGGRNNGATGEVQWYVDDAFSFADSILKIEANDTEVEPGFPYTSGVIETYGKFTQQYGYFECRMKCPAGNGFWPAFWMLPYNISWPPEIDGMENGGKDPEKAFFSFHWTDINGDHDWTTIEVDGISPSLSDAFHTFGFEWRPDRITWFLDGAQVAQFTQSQFIAAIPMYIIINLAIGSNWGDIGMPDGTTPFPSYLEVDYVRAWA